MKLFDILREIDMDAKKKDKDNLTVKEHHWDGTGKPKVGTVCEITFQSVQTFYSAEIKYFSEQLTVFSAGNLERAYKTSELKFFPFKSKEQLEKEAEKEKFVASIYIDLNKSRYTQQNTLLCLAESLYEAGYRKITD